jgi:hypothetical protein
LTKVVFSNQKNLKDREYVRIKVIWDKKPGILVPTTAISTLGGQDFVYIAKQKQFNSEQKSGSNKTETKAKEVRDSQTTDKKDSPTQASPDSLIAAQQPIKLGSIQAQDYQVISGLKEGDRIAVSNILSLRNGAAIKPTEEKQAVSEALPED